MLAQLKAAGHRLGSARRGLNPLMLRWLVVLSGAVLAGYLVWAYATRPTILTIAVGPPESRRATFVASLADALAESEASVRLKLVPVKDSGEAAAHLDDDKVMLAVVRSDEALIGDARSIAIVERRAVLLVARSSENVAPGGASPAQSGDDPSEKAPLPEVFRPERMLGKRIVVGTDELGSNRALIAKFLAHSGLAEPAVTFTEIPMAAIAATLATNQADIAVLILDVAEPDSRALVAGIAHALSGAITIGGFPSPEGLAAIYRDIAVTTVAAGVFGGLQGLPMQKISTVAITDELVADADMSDAIGAQLTKVLLERRSQMLAESGSFEIETPSLDTLRRYMPHGGVSAHYNEKSTSFLETYSDQIWLGLFALGLIGSSLAGLAHRLGLAGRVKAHPTAARIDELADDIEAATTTDEIDAVRSELRKLAKAQLRLAVNSKTANADTGLPPNWFQTLDDLALRRQHEITKS